MKDRIYTPVEMTYLSQVLALPRHPQVVLIELQAEFDLIAPDEAWEQVSRFYDSLEQELDLFQHYSLPGLAKDNIRKHLAQAKEITTQTLLFHTRPDKQKKYLPFRRSQT